jgi:hypothetical protein
MKGYFRGYFAQDSLESARWQQIKQTLLAALSLRDQWLILCYPQNQLFSNKCWSEGTAVLQRKSLEWVGRTYSKGGRFRLTLVPKSLSYHIINGHCVLPKAGGSGPILNFTAGWFSEQRTYVSYNWSWSNHSSFKWFHGIPFSWGLCHIYNYVLR